MSEISVGLTDRAVGATTLGRSLVAGVTMVGVVTAVWPLTTAFVTSLDGEMVVGWVGVVARVGVFAF